MASFTGNSAGADAAGAPAACLATAADSHEAARHACTAPASSMPASEATASLNSSPEVATSSGASVPSAPSAAAATTTRPALPPRLPAAAKLGVPRLPVRPAGMGSGSAPLLAGVVDPDESEATRQVRLSVHAIRVSLIRTARRLGYDHDNGVVKQVLYRLYLAEKLKEPFKKGRRPDPAALAARDATKAEAAEGPESPLDLHIKILVIGLAGAGKTQLCHSLLGMSAQGSEGVAPFGGQTQRVEVLSGHVAGLRLTLIDTPGLHASAAGFSANHTALRAIRGAFRRQRPDLVIYVDRFDQPSRSGAEMAVLTALTAQLGPAVWLNTLVVLTHAGAMPPAGARGQLGYDDYWQQRSQLLQLIIRNASGDARLMNPIALAESHPACRRNAQGQLVIPSGVAWQQHLMLMVVSAKLLADAEVALQMAGGGGAGASTAGPPGSGMSGAMQALMRESAPPVRYLMTALTQFSQPLTYPDHGSVMEVRGALSRMPRLKGARQKRELHRQVRMRLLQLSHLAKRQQRAVDMQARATKAGAKMMPEPPRTATRSRPGTQPPQSWRYRVPEPGAGWIVRPNLEPHGMDNSDGVEGFALEKTGVARRSGLRDAMLWGAPYRLSASCQASKEQVLVQARGEMSCYHDTTGRASTTLSTDIQTSGASGTPDLLCVVRADTQCRGMPSASNAPSMGLMLARLSQEGRLHHGPLALGARLQDSLRLRLPGGAGPLDLDMAAGQVRCRPGELEAEDAWAVNAEARTDARGLLGGRFSAPLSLSSSVMNHKGETVSALAAGLQVRTGTRSGIGGRLQLNSRGVGQLSLQVRGSAMQWPALVGLVPLFNLAVDMLRSSRGAAAGSRQHMT